jgi:RND family efflux transporter MFP subunit
MATVRALVPALILAAAIAGMMILVKTKPEADKKAIEERGVLVELTEVQPGTERVEVIARGSVVPARRVILSSEVGGRVIWVADDLLSLGSFNAGDSVLRVDPRDYRIAVEQQNAAVRSAETELELERSRKTVAEKEWERFGDKRGATPALAVREPQLKTAQVAVKSAESGLRKARLAVSRTVVKAPFPGYVAERNVELGQVVAPGTPVATLVGTDAYWVQVSVPVSELGWFKIPGVNGDDGSVVDVRQRRGDRTLTWKGQVLRLLGEVDPIGRMARVLVEIRDPLGQRPEGLAEGERAPPILVGSYVEVAISAREVDKAFAVPRSALRDGDQVFVMNGSGKLEIRPVDIAWRRPTDVLVIGGLAAGDRLITSPIPAPVAGMTLRVKGESEQAAKAADAAPGDEKPETVEAN